MQFLLPLLLLIGFVAGTGDIHHTGAADTDAGDTDTAEAPGFAGPFAVDPRHTLITEDAVEFPVHQRNGERLLPEDATREQRFAVLDADPVILRTGPVEDPGRRDNLTTLTRGEDIWLLDYDVPHDAWLVHASDGYIGYVDGDALKFVDAATFAKSLRSHTSEQAQARIAKVIANAKAKLGTPYLWGGKTDQGIDCSGLTQTAYASIGVMLPRDSDMQSEVGRLVATRWFTDGLLPGDLLFFMHPRRGKITHVALYLGDGRYIESGGPGVRYGSLDPDSAEYDAKRGERFAWARRVLE